MHEWHCIPTGTPARRPSDGCDHHHRSYQKGCPCGYLGDSDRQCIGPPSAVARHSKCISGPLLDRIDIHFAATPKIRTNADMGPAEVRQHRQLDTAGQSLMRAAMRQLQFSARVYHHVLKLARTIADLAGSNAIRLAHLGLL